MRQGPIYILGFMASGKSALAPKLARALACDCIDLDQMIEASAGKSISQLFQEEGEEAFRQREAQILRSIDTSKTAVVALGGGTPAHQNNMPYIKAIGISIYLQFPAEILIGRLRQQKQNRPLIQGKEQDEIASYVRDLLSLRESYYLLADHVIDGQQLKLQELVNLLMKSTS